MSSDPANPVRVLIAGGGVAALEGALALRKLAGDLVELRILAPAAEFLYRPMTVQEPFAFARAQRYPLDEIARDLDAELIEDALERVDQDVRSVRTASGAQLGYDVLLLGLGARIQPRYEHVVTIDDRRLDELLHGLVQDVEDGLVKRLAFVIPPRMAWPLPIYELALLSSGRAYEMGAELAVTIVTPEASPLEVFGEDASRAVQARLDEAGVELIAGAQAQVERQGEVTIGPAGRRLGFDRVVALPELEGPSIAGLPAVEGGFVPIDEHGCVRGADRVYAAGDATDFSIKHGSIAAQQADAAAESIAALAGTPLEPTPFRPFVQGVLLTGAEPIHMSSWVGDTRRPESEPSEAKIAAKYLAPYLEQRYASRR